MTILKNDLFTIYDLFTIWMTILNNDLFTIQMICCW